MIRQEFESGQKFITILTPKSEIFEFRKYSQQSKGCIISEHDTHEASISKITKYGFHFFKYVLHKKVRGIIKFSDCEVITV
jgi:hypothetical protein